MCRDFSMYVPHERYIEVGSSKDSELLLWCSEADVTSLLSWRSWRTGLHIMTWLLTSLPLKEFGFTLHKGAYRDAIALHYGWQPSYCPSSCACGSNVSVERTLSCPKGSFPTICHNEVRDFTANLMTVVCHDFCVEPSLQPIGEVFSNATAILMTVPDSTLQQMDFGVVILREPSSMCEFSTPMLLQTDNNSPPAIKKEKEKSLNKEFVKLSIVPSFLWSCH